MPGIFFSSSEARFVDEKKVVSGIKALALRAAERNHKIKEVYLFGSYSDGNAGPRSDADVCIVLSEDKRNMIDRLTEFILAFADAPVPVDVLVYTQDEVERSLKEKNSFVAKSMAGIRLV